jgi:electron transport complex protein RnfG
MLRLGITLMVVGAIAAFGLGITYAVTKKKIDEENRLAEAKASMAALPGIKSPSELKEDPRALDRVKKKVPDVQKVLTSSKGDIFIMQTKGYGGPLQLAVGVGKDGKVAGVSVISNKETMGLGSKVLAEENLVKYEGKTADDPLEVGKDVQAVTGATISTRAVTDQVKKALEAFSALQ